MKPIKKKVYAWAYDKRPNGLVGMPFKTRKEAMKYKEIYEKKGWTGGLVKLDAPKPLTEAEKKDLQETSKFLKRLKELM